MAGSVEKPGEVLWIIMTNDQGTDVYHATHMMVGTPDKGQGQEADQDQGVEAEAETTEVLYCTVFKIIKCRENVDILEYSTTALYCDSR